MYVKRRIEETKNEEETNGEETKKYVKRVQSFSSLTTFKQCPQKYFLRYQSGLERKNFTNRAIEKGKEIHDALEKNTDIKKYDEEIRFCRNENGVGIKDFKGHSMTSKIDLVRKTQIISHQNIEKDGHGDLVWIEKEKNFKVVLVDESDEELGVTFVDEAPRKLRKKYENEKGIFRGVADLIIYTAHPEIKETGNLKHVCMIEIIDYKTGKSKGVRKQLDLYAFALSLRYTEAQIVCKFIYASQEKTDVWIYDEKREKKLIEWLENTTTELENETAWAKTYVMCDWCEFSGEECPKKVELKPFLIEF